MFVRLGMARALDSRFRDFGERRGSSLDNNGNLHAAQTESKTSGSIISVVLARTYRAALRAKKFLIAEMHSRVKLFTWGLG